MTRAGAVPTVSQRRINRAVVSGSSSTGKVTVKSSESSVMAVTGVGDSKIRHQPRAEDFPQLLWGKFLVCFNQFATCSEGKPTSEHLRKKGGNFWGFRIPTSLLFL